MPRSLDPDSRLTMVLACDVDKMPLPRIFARTLTLNQQRRLMQVLELMRGATPEKSIDAAMDAAEICLTGWENMNDPVTGEAIAYCRDAIGNVLTIEELGEIFEAVTSSGQTSPDDKKKSESLPS